MVFPIILFLLVLIFISFLVNSILSSAKRGIYITLTIIALICTLLFAGLCVHLNQKYNTNVTVSIIPITNVYEGSGGGYYVKEDKDFYEIKQAEVYLGEDDYIICKVYPNMKRDYSFLFGLKKYNYTIVTKNEIAKFPAKEDLK